MNENVTKVFVGNKRHSLMKKKKHNNIYIILNSINERFDLEYPTILSLLINYVARIYGCRKNVFRFPTYPLNHNYFVAL